MRTFKVLLAVSLLAWVAGANTSLGQGTTVTTNFFFSVDIGSDKELSDPNVDGDEAYDPGDIYKEGMGPAFVKDDLIIFNVDPAPAPPVPVNTNYGLVSVTNFFDLDGEDQLDDEFIITTTNELQVVRPGGGLYLNPDKLFYSLDDDGAQGWYKSPPTYPAGDVPVNAPPDRGAATNEVVMGSGWSTWLPVPGNPVKTETDLALGPDPGLQNEDDDVDALDLETRLFWYWSCDHEATWNLDPANIYVTFPPLGGFFKAVDRAALNLAIGTDIDGFEFIVTDDPAVLMHFNAPLGQSYLALLFSVDDDDPITPVDESGGLSPNDIYISLLNGVAPLSLSTREGDVDAITVAEKDPPEIPECVKWLQEPDCDLGVDVDTWRIGDSPGPTPEVADDWYCDGRPITAIRWWGSYIGYETNSSTVTSPPAFSRPMGFALTWYTDVPTGTLASWSMPGYALATNYYQLSSFQTYVPGQVYETTQCDSRLTFIDTNVWEHEFMYYVNLTSNEWLEKEGRVYWLSIQAIYSPAGGPEYFWGWKTTPPEQNWNDDAALRMGSAPMWTNIVYPPPGWGQTASNHPFKGLSVNMAFELLSDICPSRCTKWSQRPDMLLGDDMVSYEGGIVYTNIVRIDDFVSDGRPITDIHWWGSYIGWQHENPYSETNPAPVPPAGEQLLGFRLSWHDTSAGCTPWPNAITNIFVPITNCHEVYFCTVTQFWIDPFYYEHEFQYYVDLLDPTIPGVGPWPETNGGHYWINIQGVFETNWLPSRHAGWGWKLAESKDLCPSMVTIGDGWGWRVTNMPPPHPLQGLTYDLAFELTTTNVDWSSNAVQPGFVRMYLSGYTNTVHLWSTGYCGCGKQVIQSSTNLVMGEAGWVDQATNKNPKPQNLWPVSLALTNEFFRLKNTP